LLFELRAVKAAKKVNALSRVHNRLIQPVEPTEQGNAPRLSFLHTVFCQTACRTIPPATTRAYDRADARSNRVSICHTNDLTESRSQITRT
jgi:hypothetical protein